MRRNIVAAGLLVMLAVTAVWWLVIMRPMNGKVDTAREELAAARDREGVLRGEIARLTAISDQEVTYLFALGQMQTAIPDDPEVASFLEEVNFLADQTGVELSTINLSPPLQATDQGYDEIATSISLQGQYFEILGFLYGLEAMDRIVRVDRVDLTPVEVAPGGGEATSPPDESSSTTTTAPAHPRPEITTLQGEIGAVLFTRPALVSSPGGGETTPPTTGAPTTSTTEAPAPPDGGPSE